MKVTAQVISNRDELAKIENTLNSFAARHSENPFLLSGFILQFFNTSLDGWMPLLIIISVNDNIIGVAPLKIKRRFGIVSVKFLQPSHFFPDFIVQQEYREKCIKYILDFLFKRINCHFLDLIMEDESPNLDAILKQCKTGKNKLYTQFIKMPNRTDETKNKGHSILFACTTWDEYYSSRGSNFRNKLKRMKRKLSKAGSWGIRCIENENIGHTTIQNVFHVEKASWKQKWREIRNLKIDENLRMILKASQHARKNEPNFNWSIWFLELNNETLAYCLVITYKNTTFLVKTSYDSKFRRLSPGVYLINEIIRHRFENTKKFDFITILPFIQTWTKECRFRKRILVKKGISSNLIYFFTRIVPLNLGKTFN